MDCTLNQVKRALNFWAIRAVDMESLKTASHYGKKTLRSLPLKLVVNQGTGKAVHVFNERNWGAETRSLVESARAMRTHRITQVMELAREYNKASVQQGSTGGGMETAPNDHQVLVDLSSSDEEVAESGNFDEDCEFVFIHYFAPNSWLLEALLGWAQRIMMYIQLYIIYVYDTRSHHGTLAPSFNFPIFCR